MPRKKKEEEVAATGESSTEATEASVVENASEENTEVSEPDSNTATEDETPSAIESFAETLGSAVGSAAATVSSGISSLISSVTGGSVPAEDATAKHSKRAERIGIVQSDKMTKTVTVRVERQVKHPIYRKYIKRRKNFMAHDEQGAAIGDKVRIVETRPMSAKKRWRVVEIIQKAVK